MYLKVSDFWGKQYDLAAGLFFGFPGGFFQRHRIRFLLFCTGLLEIFPKQVITLVSRIVDTPGKAVTQDYNRDFFIDQPGKSGITAMPFAKMINDLLVIGEVHQPETQSIIVNGWPFVAIGGKS
jgi:hypothetical protein